MTVDSEDLPKHIAIIMDGNGRWAKSRNLSRTQGHIAGVKRVEDIMDYANERGIQALTLFTFSTENWNRPKTEVLMLMNTITAVLTRKIKKLKRDNIRFQMIGRKEDIPEVVLTSIENMTEETRENTGLCMNLAFNYGSRMEILDAVKGIAADVKKGDLSIDAIDDDLFGDYLYTKGLPDPDLLIRTSGEKRISNFLLWQLSYAEFYFTEKYWPDFDIEQFEQALSEYQNRERRFGAVRPKPV